MYFCRVVLKLFWLHKTVCSAARYIVTSLHKIWCWNFVNFQWKLIWRRVLLNESHSCLLSVYIKYDEKEEKNFIRKTAKAKTLFSPRELKNPLKQICYNWRNRKENKWQWHDGRKTENYLFTSFILFHSVEVFGLLKRLWHHFRLQFVRNTL